MRNLFSAVRLTFRKSCLIIVLLIASESLGQENTVVARGWTHDFLEDNPDLKDRQFFLAILSFTNDRLVGCFAFRNPSVGPILLHGTRTSQGDFWPIVRLQIGNVENGDWTSFTPDKEVRSTAELQIEPRDTVRLMVAMDTFRPFAEKYRFGRVVLENGEAAWFELKDLHPSNDNGK